MIRPGLTLTPTGRQTIVQRVIRDPVFWISVSVCVAAVVLLVLHVGGGGGSGGGVGY